MRRYFLGIAWVGLVAGIPAVGRAAAAQQAYDWHVNLLAPRTPPCGRFATAMLKLENEMTGKTPERWNDKRR